jgi:DNA-binding MarR family transcriptional regulator
MSKIFGMEFKKKSENVRSIYQITPLGKRRVEDGEVNNTRMTILAHISDNGPSSATEISEETRIPLSKVKIMLRRMTPHFVNKVGREID